MTDDPQIIEVLSKKPIPISDTFIRECAVKNAGGQSTQTRVDYDSLDERLSHLMGQDKAKEAVRELIMKTQLDLLPRTRPITILCAGPSGVGKSELARIVAQELCHTDPIMLSMTEFSDPSNITRIIGAAPGYKGSDSHTELPFDALESNPYQVILLDEMEKGAREVQQLFMGAFDDGYIKAANGKTIDFSKAIVFVTTNASFTNDKQTAVGFTKSLKPSHADLVSNLSRSFSTEFLNRFTAILQFEPIPKETYRAIVADKYETEVARLRSERAQVNLPDHLDDEALDAIVEDTYNPSFGARPARRAVEEHIARLAFKELEEEQEEALKKPHVVIPAEFEGWVDELLDGFGIAHSGDFVKGKRLWRWKNGTKTLPPYKMVSKELRLWVDELDIYSACPLLVHTESATTRELVEKLKQDPIRLFELKKSLASKLAEDTGLSIEVVLERLENALEPLDVAIEILTDMADGMDPDERENFSWDISSTDLPDDWPE